MMKLLLKFDYLSNCGLLGNVFFTQVSHSRSKYTEGECGMAYVQTPTAPWSKYDILRLTLHLARTIYIGYCGNLNPVDPSVSLYNLLLCSPVEMHIIALKTQ